MYLNMKSLSTNPFFVSLSTNHILKSLSTDPFLKSLSTNPCFLLGLIFRYTHSAMIVKNSWGAWGMSGYFYTARGHHGCQIYNHGNIPTWKSTGILANTTCFHVIHNV